MASKHQKEISGQFGVRAPKAALIIEPLNNGQGEHWLTKKAGIKARYKDLIKKRDAAKRLQRFHLPDQHDQLDHGNWADGEQSPVSQLPEGQRKKFLKLESEIAKNEDFETGVIAWSDGQVTTRRGEKTRILWDDKVSEFKKDGNAILTHNHPVGVLSTGSVIGFSVADIQMAMKTNLKEIRAVVNHPSGYYTFSMQRPKAGWPSDGEFGKAVNSSDIRNVITEVVSRYKEFAGSAEAKKSFANQLELGMSHARAKMIAKQLGLTYRMVKVSDKNIRA